ncbi:MAG: GNAT family N-acetyltransferase [Pontixanthobacter sp.]
MDYSTRRYRDDDADALHTLTLSAIKEIGLSGYSQEQVDAWAARHGSAERLRERVKNGHAIFVAADCNDSPVAFSLLEPDGHLDQLYCHPDHTRRGLADRLLVAAEEFARSKALTRLYTEASELARRAFERAGYAVSNRRDFHIDGVPIHNYAMEKDLN